MGATADGQRVGGGALAAACALLLGGACLGTPDGVGLDVAPPPADAADTLDTAAPPEVVEVPPTGTCAAGVVGGRLGRTTLLIGGDVSDEVFAELPLDLRAATFTGPIPRHGGLSCDDCRTCVVGATSCGGGGAACGWWGCRQAAALPPGRALVDFLNHTAGGGAVPIVTYRVWEELAGEPPGLAEIQALQRGELVRDYLADYRLFCRAVGELRGFRAIIHLEPDLAGHAQRAGDTPANVPVALGFAAVPECAGLPDDFGGLSRCLVRLARAEAPDALVAVHASPWAAGPDAFFTVDPQFDPFPSAGRVGAFLNDAGGDEADLVALEMSDRDAGYDGRWWDERDRVEPNFVRAIRWAGVVGRALDAPVLWWRVPFGNPALDDSCGRYADNRLDYVFDHAAELAAAGVLGVSFGAGAACMTTADTDDDHFLARERAYLQSGGAPLCGGR